MALGSERDGAPLIFGADYPLRRADSGGCDLPLTSASNASGNIESRESWMVR